MADFTNIDVAGRRNAVSGNMAAVLSTVIWAAGFPAAEILLDKMDPLSLIVLRTAVACGFMLFVWWLVEGGASVLRARWARGMVMGASTFGIATFLLIWAQDLTDAVTVAILGASYPLLATGLEVVTEGRRVTPRLLVGLFAALLGGVIAAGDKLSLDLGLGALAIVVSGLLFSRGSQLSVRLFPEASPIARTTLPLAGALALLGPVLLLAQVVGWVTPVSLRLSGGEWQMLLVYSIGAMAVSQFFFISAVGRIGVAMTSFHLNVAPFYVMLIMLALGADWSWAQAIGAVIVLAGAAVVQVRR